MKTILTTVFPFLALALLCSSAYAHDEDAGHEHGSRPEFLRILSYEQILGLSEASRNQYMRSIGEALVALSNQKSETLNKNKKVSFFEQLFSLGSIAYAAPLYQCIGGGVPVDAQVGSCGVQSYAGFTCANAGENICNPMVFGVSSSGKPVCHAQATTKWCFDNTKLGVDHFLGPVFKANKVEDWNKLRGALEQACNDRTTIKENQRDVSLACGYVRQQQRVNEDVRKLMEKGYSYKGETHADACDHSCLAAAPTKSSTPTPARTNLQNLKDISVAHAMLKSLSGFYPTSHSYNRNSKSASIPGVAGELVSPMPGCSSKDHYHHRGHAFHAAQDLVAPMRTPVQSVAPGVVVTATAKGDGYGKSVVIMHKTADGEVFYSGYHHLDSFKLRPGDRVAAGSVLGAMGNTGVSTGPHLHFEIMDKNQTRSNPLAYYPQGICSHNSVQAGNLAAL